MTDVESEVYTSLAHALRKKFPGISVSSDYVNCPSNLPHVHIELKDDYGLDGYADSTQSDRFRYVWFDICIYSGRTGHKKEECKNICNVINSILYPNNFTRTSCTPIDNLADNNIYRLMVRYTAVYDEYEECFARRP